MKPSASLIIVFGLIFSPLLSTAQDAPSTSSRSAADSKAFQDRVQRMNKLDERVKAHEESFRQLVIKKREAKSSQEKRQIIDEMKEAYSAYEKDMDDLVAVKKDLKYRFPSEGEAIELGYRHVEKKSHEELEKTVDLSSTLSQVKSEVDEKYKSFMPPQPVTPKNVDKKKTQHPREQKQSPRLRLER